MPIHCSCNHAHDGAFVKGTLDLLLLQRCDQHQLLAGLGFQKSAAWHPNHIGFAVALDLQCTSSALSVGDLRLQRRGTIVGRCRSTVGLFAEQRERALSRLWALP
jgi:hypothetical protein